MCRAFNIRVYGIFINDQNDILLSHENRFGHVFVKFPGGGLEFGEGMHDCLIRECKEEMNIDLSKNDLEHLYTTDFFQPSAFNSDHQLLSVYYKVHYNRMQGIKTVDWKTQPRENEELFKWVKVEELTSDVLTFPVDKHLFDLL